LLLNIHLKSIRRFFTPGSLTSMMDELWKLDFAFIYTSLHLLTINPELHPNSGLRIDIYANTAIKSSLNKPI